MSIENRPEYRAAVIQMKADGRELDEEHQLVAERARHRIMALIMGGVVKRVVRIEEEPHESDFTDEVVS